MVRRLPINAFMWLCAIGICIGITLVASPSAGELKPDAGAVFPVETLIAKTGSGEFKFTVEIVDEHAERARGLMFRETMLPTHGMLFIFDEMGPVFMWMKDTVLPLDMIFVKPNGLVARIEQDTTPHSLKVIGSGEPVTHVLELNAGMSRLIGLKPGDRLIHPFFDPSQ